MGCCSSQHKPEGAGVPIGSLVASGTGCCNQPPYTFREPGMCDPAPAVPTGASWEAAKPSLDVLIGEVDGIITDKEIGCCGHPDLKACKAKLDQEWIGKVQEALKPHGLTADLEQFWIYNGQSASEHMNLRIFTFEEFAKNSPPAEGAEVKPTE